ncbi:MAG: hypothetical protein P1V20_17225 [Verrucomicrobiales bacterium]|nr:hypothetical protein [Verrucomicrobiales bacterium]
MAEGLGCWLVVRTSSGRVAPFVENVKDISEPYKPVWNKQEEQLHSEFDVVAIFDNIEKRHVFTVGRNYPDMGFERQYSSSNYRF